MDSRDGTLRQIARDICKMLLLSAAVCLVVEGFNHRSIGKLILFLQEHPWMFLFNAWIIFNTFLFAEIWRRRRGARIVTLILWLVLGVANYAVATYRVQPFTPRDILMVRDGLKMITVYFTWPEIIFMFGGGGLMAFLIVLTLVKSKKREGFNRLPAIALLVACAALSMFVGRLLVVTRAVEWDKTSLIAGYRNYGFPYSFGYALMDMGIQKPEQYSEGLVEELGEEIADPELPIVVQPEATLPPEKAIETITPNIVFVQLESFFDVNSVLDAQFSENPIPVFTDLMRNWPSAQLLVPVVGGGTANTEFEVLSGMNLDYFGIGEYPYNTILMDTTCETICFNLKPLGYTATALHNYMGSFYGRNTVYAQLGFDRFASQEYMNGLSYNALEWARDDVLTGQVMKAMETTEGRDFVFAVTVQSHGKYPTTPIEGLDAIDVLGCGEAVNPVALKNYVNEIHEVDRFIGELARALEEFEEPTVLVLYGDHLPAIGVEEEQLACGDLYQTTYVLWNNFGMRFKARDLQAYQLSANVLGQLGLENGALMRFHQRFGVDATDEEYLDLLRVLEYDVLYGEMAIYEGVNPYQPTNLQMGIVPIRANRAVHDAAVGTLSVYGVNFTPCSDIVVGGERQKAVFVDDTRLIARVESVDPAAEIVVGQFTRENEELSRTNVIRLEES